MYVDKIYNNKNVMKKKPKIKSVKEYPYGGAALTGALTGASLGMELGPWGALAGAGVGAGLGYINEQNQEAQNKQYAIDQNLNNIRSQGVQRIKSAPIVEGAPQAAYKNGGIHIKPSHKGRFTAYKQRTGKTTEEALHSKDPHVRQMANFARNAAKWKHENGGIHQDFLNDAEVYNYPNGGITGFTLTPSDYFPNGGKYVTPLANLNNFYPPMKKQVIVPTKKYPNGGMSVTNDNNAEVEKEEVMRSPDGSTMQVDGNSHAQGGVPVNIPNGTQIYSDRLKDPETKKTFAKLAEKYKVNKEEEILENKKSSSLATNTAKLNMQIKQQKLNEIFNKQELLKRSKVGNYAKKLGVDISQLSSDNGSHYQQPEDHPEELKYAYGGMKYPDGGWMNQSTQYNQFNPNNFNQSYVTPGYTANYDGTNSGMPYSSAEGTFDTDGNKIAEPYGKKKKIDYTGALAKGIGAASNFIEPLYNLTTNKQSPHFDYVTPDLKQYDPTNSLKIADQENRMAREQARVNSGGNANAYLSSLAAMQSNLTRNKAGIQQQYDQLNTSAYNNLQPTIADIKNRTIDANQQNQARYRDINRQAVGQLGSVVGNTAQDIGKGIMDKKSLAIISGMYPDYEYDNSKNGWFHKKTNKRLISSNI